MYPDKHFRDELKSLRKKSLAKKFSVMACFLISFLFFGPLIHELAHIATLIAYSCPYSKSFEWVVSGLRANIKPLCSISGIRLASFYLVGYTSTITVGASLELISSISSRGKKLLSATSLGLLLSVVISVGQKGDIINALQIYGLSSQIFLVLTVLFIVTAYFALHSTETFLSERQE